MGDLGEPRAAAAGGGGGRRSTGAHLPRGRCSRSGQGGAPHFPPRTPALKGVLSSVDIVASTPPRSPSQHPLPEHPPPSLGTPRGGSSTKKIQSRGLRAAAAGAGAEVIFQGL